MSIQQDLFHQFCYVKIIGTQVGHEEDYPLSGYARYENRSLNCIGRVHIQRNLHRHLKMTFPLMQTCQYLVSEFFPDRSIPDLHIPGHPL